MCTEAGVPEVARELYEEKLYGSSSSTGVTTSAARAALSQSHSIQLLGATPATPRGHSPESYWLLSHWVLGRQSLKIQIQIQMQEQIQIQNNK